MIDEESLPLNWAIIEMHQDNVGCCPDVHSPNSCTRCLNRMARSDIQHVRTSVLQLLDILAHLIVPSDNPVRCNTAPVASSVSLEGDH